MFSFSRYSRNRNYKPLLKRFGELCKILFIITCISFIILLIISYLIKFTDHVNILYVEIDKPTHITNSKFLSVGLDSSLIAEGFRKFDMKNQRLLKLINALSPAYLRIGGTMADRLIFSLHKHSFKKRFIKYHDSGDCSNDGHVCFFSNKPNFTMNAKEWLQLNELSKITKLDIIFDLNALIRFGNGSWDYHNAQKLIQYSDLHQLNLNWELGNEPNSFRHQFNYEVNATQLADDFLTLKQILMQYPRYKHSLIVGPDTTRPRLDNAESVKYLTEFVRNAGHLVDVITWHQYYFNGRTARSDYFLNPLIFDVLKWQINIIKNTLQSEGLSHKPLWLGETSSAWSGGAPNYSDSFISTFIWLDKLGISAKMGLDVVIRQSLFKGYYALIDDDYNPVPDWWVSILYKNLVGSQVISCYTASSLNIRLYCHCTKNGNGEFWNSSSITIFGMNLAERKTKVRIEGIPVFDQYNIDESIIYSYSLTTNSSLISRNLYLNGKLLDLTSTNDVPNFEPEIISALPYVEILPYSLVFWVIPIKNLTICDNF